MTLEQIFAMVDARCAAERADAISKWRGHRIRAGIIRARARRYVVTGTGGGGDWSAIRFVGGAGVTVRQRGRWIHIRRAA
jgi:hypothetical protein